MTRKNDDPLDAASQSQRRPSIHDLDKTFNKEENRLLTFRRWPVTSAVSSDRLARAGFIFTERGDAVECFACGGVLENWDYGDDVMRKHRQSFPTCPFVLGQANNVPFYKSGIDSKMHMQLLESLESSVSRSTTPSSSGYLFAREDGSRSSRYESSDSAYRSVGSRRISALSNVPSDITDPSMDDLDMRILENRLKSFHRWPISFISSRSLSASGFYFTGFQDRVRCAFCGGILGMWQPGDDPWMEHHKHFPWCGYGKKGRTSDYSSTHSSPSGNNGFDVCGNTVLVAPSSIPSKYPCSPYLADYQTRLTTFKNWPPNRNQTPKHLASAGFFFTGVNDNVRCFHCDGGLRCWEPPDEAWHEHAKWFPQCAYLIETKGQEFVDAVQNLAQGPQESTKEGEIRQTYTPTTPLNDEESIVRKALEMGFSQSSIEAALRERHVDIQAAPFRTVEDLINSALEVENRTKKLEAQPAATSNRFLSIIRSFSKDESNDATVEKLAEENRILKRQRQCKVCLDREVSTVFLPCGHVMSCGQCAPSLRNCTKCRRVIRGTVNIHLP